MTDPTRWALLESPIDALLVTADEVGLTRLYMEESAHGSTEIGATWVHDPGAFDEVAAELRAYFAGDLRTFDLTLHLRGTSFQQSVWNELCRIPYGATTTYGALAKRLGRPGSSRAVGLANAYNPISIVVPCHRVIGADGSLTGYGGGVERKRFLLDLERRVAQPPGQQQLV